MFMAEILRPSLELLRIEFQIIGELDQRAAERVRIEIGQARSLEGFLEDGADRMRSGPMRALQAIGHKAEVRASLDALLGKNRVFQAKAFFGPQER